MFFARLATPDFGEMPLAKTAQRHHAGVAFSNVIHRSGASRDSRWN
jgi:hypothetical protein